MRRAWVATAAMTAVLLILLLRLSFAFGSLNQQAIASAPQYPDGNNVDWSRFAYVSALSVVRLIESFFQSRGNDDS